MHQLEKNVEDQMVANLAPQTQNKQAALAKMA